MKDKYSCWTDKGPAEEAFKKLSTEIAAVIKNKLGPVPSSSLIIYDIFMIGETAKTTVPQIMFSCNRKALRKAAVDVVRKSGILKDYPGVETGHSIDLFPNGLGYEEAT
jgi:hypothetical protein